MTFEVFGLQGSYFTAINDKCFNSKGSVNLLTKFFVKNNTNVIGKYIYFIKTLDKLPIMCIIESKTEQNLILRWV